MKHNNFRFILDQSQFMCVIYLYKSCDTFHHFDSLESCSNFKEHIFNGGHGEVTVKEYR